MLLSSEQVAALLQALGLTQSIFKPIPDLVGGLTAPLDGVVSAVDGIIGGLGLPKLEDLPLIGGILEAEDPNPNAVMPMKSPQPMNLVASNSCYVEPYDPAPILSQTFPPFDQAKANVFRYRQQQSVNMGSWFVHEQWMTPSLFTCADGPQTAEIDIAKGWGNTSNARAILERHWDTFINQSDFEYLSSIGINTVRLPIGYWNLGPLYCQGTPFEPVADVYADSWSRIVRAINWAGEAGIGVLVDLHGAPGSQNGQPHSGISDGQANFFNSTNMDKTIDVLIYLMQQLVPVTNVIGIEMINEPNNDDSLSDFYDRAITAMRQVSPEAATFPIYLHDAFNVDQYSDYVSKRSDFVVEDHHSYFVFTPDDQARNATEDTNMVQTSVMNQLSADSSQERRNLVIGEWSCALVPDSLANATDPLAARQQFCDGQMQVYANTSSGWHFWSYMKEDCDTDLDWCFKNAVGNTLPGTFFSYNSDPATSPSKVVSFARAISEMGLPSMTEVLARAGTRGSDTEASDEETSTSTATDSAPAPSGYRAKRSSNSSTHKTQHRHAHSHRFDQIHHRSKLAHNRSRWQKRDEPSSSTSAAAPAATSMTAAERSITKGYSDGFLTAKIFAQYGMSRLGFKGQYVADSIAALGPSAVAPGTENDYTAWFYRGLSDAETLVGAAMNA